MFNKIANFVVNTTLYFVRFLYKNNKLKRITTIVEL